MTAGGYPPQNSKIPHGVYLAARTLRARVIESTKYELPIIVILTSYHNIPFSSCEHTWSLREALTLFRGVHRDANPPPAARPRTLREALVYGGRDIALWVPFKLYDIGDYSVALVSGGVGENEVAEWAEVPQQKPHRAPAQRLLTQAVPAAEQGVGQAPHVVSHETLPFNVSRGCATAASTVFFFLASNMREALNSQALKCLSSQPLTHSSATL